MHRWCDVCRTSSVAHASCCPLMSQTRVCCVQQTIATDSSGSLTVPLIYRSGKRSGRRQHNQTGYQSSLTRTRKELQTSGVTSNNPTAPQNKSARHPESQSASQNCLNHTFSTAAISDRSFGTEVLARRLIGTCAQMIIITNGAPRKGLAWLPQYEDGFLAKWQGRDQKGYVRWLKRW